MQDPGKLQLKDFFYELSPDRIAEFPLKDRDQSKLLVYKRGSTPDQYLFKDLTDHLPDKSLLVLNDTRVVHARLLFQKESGARIEIFCLSPVHPVKELQTAFGLSSPVIWECLIGNARRWKQGELNMQGYLNGEKVMLTAKKVAIDKAAGIIPLVETNQLIQFSWTPAAQNFSGIIDLLGTVPLPPYIHRESQESDKERYQTVYARQEGSVAAPTAGLHFTPEVFKSLKKKGMEVAYLTLHVGAGTFKPVTTESIGDHVMHAEPFEVSVDFLEFLLKNIDRPFIAVGTTSVRTLESLFLAGLRMLKGEKSLDNLMIHQWEPYALKDKTEFSRKEILESLINYLKVNQFAVIRGYTQLIIAPGYRFGMIDGMITNFHQPGSTLLLLIAAFLGDDWKIVYQFALNQNFRFLSYGDSCLFL